MMVHSRVRCFQSLPAPSQATEADHCHCKPVPSRKGDMGHLTKGICASGVNMQSPLGEARVSAPTEADTRSGCASRAPIECT